MLSTLGTLGRQVATYCYVHDGIESIFEKLGRRRARRRTEKAPEDENFSTIGPVFASFTPVPRAHCRRPGPIPLNTNFWTRFPG